MTINENQYKFNLSLDLIYFLTNALLRGNSNKTELVPLLIGKWEDRINANIEDVGLIQAEKIAETEDMEKDVAQIIVSIHQQESYILTKEFKNQIQNVILNTFKQESNHPE